MRVLLAVCVLILFAGCSRRKEPLFRIHEGSALGIDFQNTILSNDSVNALTFEYIYNGSGVGVGDFNNDGLEDLFFGGNQVSSRLYLNKGNLQFNDVTKESGVSTDRWVTGVSVVDINNDGWLDVFLAVAGTGDKDGMRDLLFINEGVKNGVPVFRESARAYGIDDDGYGTMGAFLDYDKDGDLDLYLLTNALESFNRNNVRPKRTDGSAPSTDRLYRNNGDNTFTNVAREAGITIEGYGLGVNICDLNQDGWPDVYVSNDFLTDDFVWINQRNGTFVNKAADYLKHLTHNGMGNDVADFNNDGLADIVVVDMLPPGHERQKMMTAGQNYDNFYMALDLKYVPQYMRNTLQLNRGTDKNGNLHFSEIAFQSGVAQTDWSWAPLFADFDNDGMKDLFIANGYRKDVTNLDFIFFGAQQNSPFGTAKVRQQKFVDELEDLKDVKLNNYVFRNSGTLTFEDKSIEWGMDFPTFSNGAAYADLDNDGDLDLVTNNIDQQVLIYENSVREQRPERHFIKLKSDDANELNTQILVYTRDGKQFQEMNPYRGFQSSVSREMLFGIGENKKADSVIVQWNNGYRIKFMNVPADTSIVYSKAKAAPGNIIQPGNNTMLTEISPSQYRHQENSLPDIKNTRTLLHELSRYGPCVTTGDINGDGRDDLYVGQEAGQARRILLQTDEGTFREQLVGIDATGEDGAVLLFDADGDNDLDLYVGATCSSSRIEPALHKLYLNDGKGNLSPSDNLPIIKAPASCVEANDYDSDGDLDLFVGGRMRYDSYPLPDRSYILRNDNGNFQDVTGDLNQELLSPGLVSDAAWSDLDGDAHAELIIAGEWMPVHIYKFANNRFEDVSQKFGLSNTNGWWRSITIADINNDGWNDIIAGNAGKNSFLKATTEQPIEIVAKDFDKNGSVDPIVNYYNASDQKRFTLHNRLVLIDQLPKMKKQFETFASYAQSPFSKVFTDDETNDAYKAKVQTLASVVLTNQAGKKMEIKELPEIAQIAPINDVMVMDINKDKIADLVVIGNDYAQETLFGRYDASIGSILIGDNKGGWANLELAQSGFLADKDARHLSTVKTRNGTALVVTNNDDSLQWYLVMPALPGLAKEGDEFEM